MGPRLFSRGNPKRHGRDAMRRSRLQWGRGFSAAEIATPPVTLCFRCTRASMGPRLFSRGNLNHSCVLSCKNNGFNGAAAFQPRKSVVVECFGRVGRALFQWGRGFSAAEMRQPANRESLSKWLQWGRGFSAAEIREAELKARTQSGFNGAAAFQPRKYRVPMARDIAAYIASMGPRLFSRGNRIISGWPTCCGSSASMGPRLFSRGNRPIRTRCADHCAAASMGPRLFSRGNWAAAGFPLRSQVASMGPRLFSRGNGHRRDSHGDRRQGFNGAAAFQPRKWRSRGHRPRAFRASMGPRLFSRGNGDRQGQVALGPSASMGPRLFSRGNHDPSAWHRGKLRMLQWGRGFSAAEIAASREPGAHAERRFNGAAAFQPRKSVSPRQGVGERAGASMGPRLFSRGNLGLRGLRGLLPGFASMGPRLFSRGNIPTMASRATSGSFNGAAAFQPRK